jgi:acetyl-CoA C-acetyltransferase
VSATGLREAVICEPARTPIGRYGGAFRGVSVQELAATVIAELLRRTSLSGTEVDDVILGNCYPTMDAPALGRVAALDAGLPTSVPGRQLDRRCGSGLQAVIDAALAVQTGGAELIVAGGAESMSRAPLYSTELRWGTRGKTVLRDALEEGRVTAGGARHPVPGGMIETAENLRREYDISRAAQDDLALASHRRAVSAQDRHDFAAEIVPVTVLERGEKIAVTKDEHPRPEISADGLARLRPMMADELPEATVTAGNSSGQNDGAAVCIVTHPANAERLGLRPVARLVSWAAAGVDPETMGIGAVPATNKALARAGLGLADLDLIEINEAFAVQVLSCLRAWGLGSDDLERINVNGSGISLGHPAGATGARILCTLLRTMQRRGARYGLETMCIGGGQGLAAVFERM